MHNIILVVINYYTKIARYISIQKAITIIELANLFIKYIVRFFSLLIGIVSNRGSLFIS